MENGETKENEWENTPFSKFEPYFNDAMKTTNLKDIHPNPFLTIGDSPSLTHQFEVLFNDIARHYSSLFPPQNESEKREFRYRVYPETNFNARIAEALLSLLTFTEKERCGWNGYDLAKYSVTLLDEIFSLNDEGKSLFPCITSIKERAALHPNEPYILFSVTYVDHDLEGKCGFSVSLEAQKSPK